MFEFLFKYRRLLFERGDFVLGAPWPVTTLAVVGAIAVLVAASYGLVRGRSSPVDRWVLGGLRVAVLAVLAFLLMRPTLVVPTVVPQQNFLGVLVDDSRSMQIADGGEETRGELVRRLFGSAESELLNALSETFVLRFFRFDSEAERLASVADLTFDGTRTEVGQALERARQELAGVPLSGLVLVTDGADNAQTTLSESLVALKAGSVPVYAVGLGNRQLDRDIQLSRVETPRRVLKGASLVVDLVITQRGYRGRTVPVYVEDDSRIVSETEVQLPADGEPTTVRVRFTATEAGPRVFRFRVPAQDDEMVVRNNVRETLIVVEDRKEKVLYFEGEPRFEVKFLRRAIAEDENLQVVVLQRTAENKFLRLAVDGPDELAAGFPTTREELFRYRGLILGSVEASFFSHDQLQMIADFVNRRGGGLLVLGGRRALAEGGYAGTPVADVLPVTLDPAAPDFYAELEVRPTRAGATHAAMQLGPTEEESAERWETLPAVSTFNPVTRVKPGATVLLAGSGPDIEDQAVLAYQRYGRGKSLAFTVHDSWLWQMHADVPLEDRSHETFWRQLLRWLIDGVPDQVRAAVARDRVEPGEAVELVATVEDSAYLEVNNSSVLAQVDGPALADSMRMDWSVEIDGEYRAAFAPPEAGLYRVEVQAEQDTLAVGSDVTYLQVAPSESEYFDAAMRAPLLRRVAEETGGRFYTADDVASLPEDISVTGGGATVMEERELWDMPVLFFLLVGLIGAEWAYRRRRGLV